MSEEEKVLINIVRSFDANFEDEISVSIDTIVQYICKLDRMWFKVYYDGQEGKIPINSCQEWSPTDMERLAFDFTGGQAAFVAKFDFISDAQTGDLVFTTNELLIGLYQMDENWWYGTRFNSITCKNNSFSVKQEKCGIFPVTHAWMLRSDLLPKSVLTSFVSIETEDNPSDNSNRPSRVFKKDLSNNNSFVKNTSIEYTDQTSNDIENIQSNVKSDEVTMFHVKVIKTMKAQLTEEIDLEEIGETFAVLSIPDKHYFYGSTLDGSRRGIFPKNFVKIIEESGKSSPEICSEPPTIAPPPLPSSAGGFVISTDISDGFNPLQEDPPSYEMAIKEAPLYSGYSNQMLKEIESYGQVLYDFIAQQDCELTVYANQIVRLIQHFDHEWLECEKDGRIGFVPKSYVKIIVDCGRSPASNSEKHSNMDSNTSANLEVEYPDDTFAEAVQDFHPQFDHDLAISSGDRLRLLKHFTNTVWVQAQDSMNRIGLVPLTYLKSIEKGTEASELIKKVPPENVLKKVEFQEPDSVLMLEKPKVNRSHRSAPSAPRETFHALPYPTLNQFTQNEKMGLPESSSSSLFDPMIPSQYPSTSSIKPSHENRASVTVQQRQCIITELIQTEKDYSSSIGVFVRIIRHMNDMERPAGFDPGRVTDDMDLVLKVSKSLLKLLENHARDRAACDQKVGICFLQLKNEIHDAYMRFCKNHDDLKQLLQTYQGKPIENLGHFYRDVKKRIQQETNCFDLYSIIIKPIQRILKYPLLLNELISCTENDHIDKKELQSALELITRTASDINELKRRQDIVEKYCKPHQDSSFVDKLGSLNRHSLLKKVGRIKNRVLSKIVSPIYEDKEYDDILYKFRHVHMVIEEFVNKLNTYVSHVKDYSLHILYVSNAFLEYLGRRKSDVEFWRDAHQECKKGFDEFLTNMNKHCLEVLKRLLNKFRNPNILIEKREDKRLDYEQSLKSRSVSTDSSRPIDSSESHFQAINIQLKEELPLLVDLSLEILTVSIRSLIVCHRKLYTKKASIFIQLHDDLPELKHIPTDFYNNIERDFRVKHNILHELMLQDFAILSISDHSEKNHSKSKNWVDPIRVVPAPSQNSENESSQNEDMKMEVQQNYSQKDLFCVIETYKTGSIEEISVDINDLVGVIKYKDPMGSEDRYYVDRGNKQKGFVRKSILKPLEHHLFETPKPTSSYIFRGVGMDNKDDCDSPIYYDVPDEDDEIKDASLSSFENVDSDSASAIRQFDPLRAPSGETGIYVAAYDYKSQGNYDLALKRGEVVTIKRKSDMDNNPEWWLVENVNKISGYVPANYLSKQ